jgi:hypothetical protein
MAALLLAFGATAAAADKHELLGAWSVDVAKLQQPEPKPRNVTITLTEAGAGRYRMEVDITAPDGTVSHAEGTFTPDGTPARGQGSLDVDIVSMTMPSRKILVMGAGMAGHPASSRVFSLSDDGTHMIETIIRHQPDGTPYTRVNTWTRK